MKFRSISFIIAGVFAASALIFELPFNEAEFSREDMYGDKVAEILRADARNSLGFRESALLHGYSYLYRFEFEDSFKLADRLRSLGFEVVGDGLVAEHTLRIGHTNLNDFLWRNENVKWIPEVFVSKEIWDYRGNSDIRFKIMIIGVDEKSRTKYAFMLSGR